MADLDHSVCSELSNYIEQLTTTGKKELDQDLMKKIKKICRTSDNYVEHTYYLLMTQLEKGHSEVRYSALLVINELFIRSHVFKELLLDSFEEFLELTAEIDPEQPLPPPHKAAKELKMKSLQIVHDWYKNFKEGYKRLTLAYHFLKVCKKVDFSDSQPQTLAQRNRVQEQQQRLENSTQEKVNKAKKEIEETVPEINRTLFEIDNLFHLLVLPVDLFTESDFKKSETTVTSNDKKIGGATAQTTVTKKKEKSPPQIKSHQELQDTESSAAKEVQTELGTDANKLLAQNAKEESSLQSNLRQHGLTDMKHNLSIEISPKSTMTVEETEENATIIENIVDRYQLIVSHFLPKTGKWLKVLTKGTGCSNLVKQAIDLKQDLEARVSKYNELKIITKTFPAKAKAQESDDDDDNDFEEVVEKEGYEPVIPPHHRKEYGLEPQPSTSTASTSKITKTERQWNIDLEEHDVRDPTTRYSTLHALCQKLAQRSTTTESESPSSETPSHSQNDLESYNIRKKKLLAQAPRRPYDIDLYHWEEEKLEVPTVVKFDSLHKFWQPIENETNEIQLKENVDSLRRRTIAFTGEFVPVKWSCRAPLPSGKLCPRQDRHKCPFHGLIIPRDELGNPSNPEAQDKVEEQPSTSQSQEHIPEWQDPELLHDIEAATGINLKLPEKRKKAQDKPKGKVKSGQKRRRYPGLTDIKTSEETSRKRLEKKVLNRFALQRVASTLDSMDKKLFMDKFGNQWNYAFKK